MKTFMLHISLLLAAMLGTSLSAQIISTDPNLPGTPQGFYTNSSGPLSVNYIFSVSTTASVSGVDLKNFTGISRVNGVSDETDSFSGSLFFANISFNESPVIPMTSVTSSGSWVLYNKVGQTTGTFATELLSLNIRTVTAAGTFFLRESPTLASTGSTTIAGLGGGQYSINSYFDVYTEISTDDVNWVPASDPIQLELTVVPEPTTIGLVVVGLLGALGIRRRKA